MLLGGDEFGRAQRGNNNAYCQDNEIAWLDWKQAAGVEGSALTAFAERIIALRHRHVVLRAPRFLHGRRELAPGIGNIAWFEASGEPVSNDSWNNPEERRVGVRRRPRHGGRHAAHLAALFEPPPHGPNI